METGFTESQTGVKAIGGRARKSSHPSWCLAVDDGGCEPNVKDVSALVKDLKNGDFADSASMHWSCRLGVVRAVKNPVKRVRAAGHGDKTEGSLTSGAIASAGVADGGLERCASDVFLRYRFGSSRSAGVTGACRSFLLPASSFFVGVFSVTTHAAVISKGRALILGWLPAVWTLRPVAELILAVDVVSLTEATTSAVLLAGQGTR
jgi:hypothetical protein